jgi:hypothetical protein
MRAGIPEIDRGPVESEAIFSIGYDAQTRTLEIEFMSGSVYRYFGVAQEFYLRFIQSDSKGRFFHAFIRGKIPFVRVR